MTSLCQNEGKLNFLLREMARCLGACIIVERIEFLNNKKSYIFILWVDFPQYFHFGIGLSEVLEASLFVLTVILKFIEVVILFSYNLFLLNGDIVIGDIVLNKSIFTFLLNVDELVLDFLDNS